MIELKKLIESLLFSSGKLMTAEELANLAKEQDLEKVKEAIALLKQELEEKDSPLELIRQGNGYKLTIRQKYVSTVKKVLTAPELPKSLLETLAVVAYKAPVLQSDVIKIRTNKAYDHLVQLEKLGYITREKRGRTKLIRVTQQFFDYFDIPPEILKKKFANIHALEKAIEQKEEKIEQTQKQIAVDIIRAKKEKQEKEINLAKGEEVYKTLERTEQDLGPLEKDAVDGLEVYYSEKKEKKKKRRKHKKKEKKKKQPEKSREETAKEIAARILGEEAQSEPETAEKKAEEEKKEDEQIKEAGRVTTESIKKDVKKAKPGPSGYEAKGLYPKGVPEDLSGQVEKRVQEITGTGKIPQGGEDEKMTEEEKKQETPEEQKEAPAEEAPKEEKKEEEKNEEEEKKEETPAEEPKEEEKEESSEEAPAEEKKEEVPAEEKTE